MNAVSSLSALRPSLHTPGIQPTFGEILVADGRLSVADANRIHQRQKEDNTSFGDAAIAMKLISKRDVDYALSKQFGYYYLSDQDSSLSAELIAAYKPFSLLGENLRALRSQLMLRTSNRPSDIQKVFAIVSPGSGDGRTFMAANLAIVFAQQGQRTLLIDGDLRNPRLQAMFKLERSPGLSGILADRSDLTAIEAIPGLPGLSVLPAGSSTPNPQELLGRPAFNKLLQLAKEQFDVIFIDTPAASQFADAEIISDRAGMALMVVRRHKSLVPQATHLAQRLSEMGVALIGSVINGD